MDKMVNGVRRPFTDVELDLQARKAESKMVLRNAAVDLKAEMVERVLYSGMKDITFDQLDSIINSMPWTDEEKDFFKKAFSVLLALLKKS